MKYIQHVVINLQLYFPNKQLVSYWKNQNFENIIYFDIASRTMLTEFFNTCSQDEEARTYLYREFIEYYAWNKQGKCWKKRKSQEVTG